MALPLYATPFGLRDVGVKSLGPDGSTPGALIDFPLARTLSFSDEEDFEDLRGDDKLAASHGNGAVCNWEIEGGGISLEAWAALAGGTVTSSGVSPNAKKVYSKKVTDQRPYVKLEGQAMNDNGGDLHGLIYKAKATESLEGEMAEGAFWLSSASGTSFPSTEATQTDKLYDFVHNETAVAIS